MKTTLATIVVLALLGVASAASAAGFEAGEVDPAACPAEQAGCPIEESGDSDDGSDSGQDGAEPTSAYGEPSASTTETMTLTTVGTLQLELEWLKRALGAMGANDPAFAEWLGRLVTCVSVEVARAPALLLSPLEARSTLRGMLAACMSKSGVTLPGGGLDGYFGLGGLGGKDAGGHGVACVNASGDPRLARDGSWGAGYQDHTAAEKAQISEKWQREYEEAVDKAAQATDAWFEALDRWDELPAGSPEKAAAWAEAEQKAEETKQADWEAFWAKVKAESEPMKPANVSLTARDADDFCRGAAEQIAECERNGWSTYDCQNLKNRMTGCGSDPAVTDPTPESEEGDPEPKPATCLPVQPSGQEAAGVALLVCEALVNTGPDGGSPCVLTVLDPALKSPFGVNGQYCIGQEGTDSWTCMVINPCSNEKIQPGQEQESCFGEATVFSFQPDVAAIVAVAHAKLGGPIWVPPTPAPSPGAPDPEPLP